MSLCLLLPNGLMDLKLVYICVYTLTIYMCTSLGLMGVHLLLYVFVYIRYNTIHIKCTSINVDHI